MASAFANEVGATATRAAMASPTVQNAVQKEAKKQMFAKFGFSSTPTEEPIHQPSMSAEGVDESIIQGIDDDELGKIEKWAKRLRVAMILVSTLCIITAFYNLATASNSVATNFLAVYVFFFSSLVCCYEVAIKQVVIIMVQNFGFLYNPIGRTIFVCFLAVLLFQLSTMGQVMFAILLVMGIVQIYVDCRHPKFEKYKMIIHYFGKASAQFRSTAAPTVATDNNPSMTV